MPEQSLAAKLRRALILRLLAMLGPDWLLQRLNLSDPEVAALEAYRPRNLHSPRSVVFAIPIVGRHQVSDWSVIEATLARTLTTLKAQTSGDWRAMICGQDRPDGLPNDPRIRFLPFAQTVSGHDKVPKLQALARALPTLGLTSGYYMPFDGDDLLGPASVAQMQMQAVPGYLVSHGHILNAATGEVAATAPQSLGQPGQKAFWKFCGSCAAFPFDLSDGAADIAFFEGLAQHEHRLYPYLAELAGTRLHPGAVPDVLYLINHGENFETRRGRGGFKQRFVARHKIANADPVLRRFGL